MSKTRRPVQILGAARMALALALVCGFVGGAAGHHDPFESAASRPGAPFSIATAASHAKVAAHFESSESEQHDGCTACLLQRRAGMAATSVAPAIAGLPPAGRLTFATLDVFGSGPGAGSNRGRAPPTL